MCMRPVEYGIGAKVCDFMINSCVCTMTCAASVTPDPTAWERKRRSPPVLPGEKLHEWQWKDVVQYVPKRAPKHIPVAAAQGTSSASGPVAVDREPLMVEMGGHPAWVWVLTGGVYLSMIVDTGAAANLISEDYVEVLSKRMDLKRGEIPFQYSLSGLGSGSQRLSQYVMVPLWMCGFTPDKGLWVHLPFLVVPKTGAFGSVLLMGNASMAALKVCYESDQPYIRSKLQPDVLIPVSRSSNLETAGWGPSKEASLGSGKFSLANVTPRKTAPVVKLGVGGASLPDPSECFIDEFEAVRARFSLPPFDTKFSCPPDFERQLADPAIFHIDRSRERWEIFLQIWLARSLWTAFVVDGKTAVRPRLVVFCR